MLYVSSKNNNGLYGVTDTDDGVEEFLSKEQLLNIVKSEDLDIDGVDAYNNMLCPVKLQNETVRLFKSGKVHLAISTMTLENEAFGLRFKSKPTRGEMSFVHHDVINISRRGVNSFSFDKGSSKSYRSGLTLDDILTVIESYNNWILEDCKIGRF
jgi:hypothetical protein